MHYFNILFLINYFILKLMIKLRIVCNLKEFLSYEKQFYITNFYNDLNL